MKSFEKSPIIEQKLTTNFNDNRKNSVKEIIIERNKDSKKTKDKNGIDIIKIKVKREFRKYN